MAELADVNLSWGKAQAVARSAGRILSRPFVSKGRTRNDDVEDDNSFDCLTEHVSSYDDSCFVSCCHLKQQADLKLYQNGSKKVNSLCQGLKTNKIPANKFICRAIVAACQVRSQ